MFWSKKKLTEKEWLQLNVAAAGTGVVAKEIHKGDWAIFGFPGTRPINTRTLMRHQAIRLKNMINKRSWVSSDDLWNAQTN